jgi:N-sulfoglucosamine sulfohydrolase
LYNEIERREVGKLRNVLYIHTHDSGRILSPYGYKVPTPNLEAFAKEAAVFRNAYCAGPTCSPSRAAMLTGTYPHQTGMLGLAQRGFSMDCRRHLVQHLNRNGYDTALCGIQHEVGWYLDRVQGAKQIGYGEELTRDNSGYRQEELVKWDQENAGEVCTWLRDRKKMGNEKKRPFFLSYGMYATHRRFPDEIDPEICPEFAVPPYPIPDSKETRRDFAGFLTSVKSADGCFGQVIRCLKEEGLWENTIVLFTTDHGIANPFSKCTLFDSGIGVALMMHVPGAKGNGRVMDQLVSHVDVFPTLCELLNLEKPDYLEGVSLVPLLEGGEEPVRSDIFAEINFHTSYEPARCVRTERYKYICYYDTSYLQTNLSNIDESQTKDYFMERGLKGREKYEEALYDLVYDPGERRNLAKEPEYKAVLEKMRDRLKEYEERTEDPIRSGPVAVRSGWKVNRRECQTASSKNPEDYI